MHIFSFHKNYTEVLSQMYQELRDFLVNIPERIDHPLGYDTTEELMGYITGWEKGEKHILLSEEKGETSGFCIGSIVSEDWEGTNIKKYGKIEFLYVDGKYRGRGVGKTLLKNMEKLFKETGISYMEVSVLAQNTGARNLYSHLEFKESLVTLGKEI